MASSLRVWGACRALTVRTRSATLRTDPFISTLPKRRWYSDETNKSSPLPPITSNSRQPDLPTPQAGSTQSESTDTSSFETTPSKQPAQDAATYLNAAPGETSAEHLDDATLEKIFYGGRAAPSEGDPGLTEAQEETLYRDGTIHPPEEAEALVAAEEGNTGTAPVVSRANGLEKFRHKFPLPERPFPPDFNHKKRYHPVLGQLTRLLMRDGKLSVAQRNMAMVMNTLRTSPAPIYSPKFPLLPGTPPASHLPLNPVLYITIAIDSVAPLVRIRHVAGGAGGGRALEVPVPLAVRQRRRVAFQWILDVVEKKPSKGSGRKQFPHRIAEEIVAVIEGRSPVWEKRKLVHKLGTAARSNVSGSKRKNKHRG